MRTENPRVFKREGKDDSSPVLHFSSLPLDVVFEGLPRKDSFRAEQVKTWQD